MDSVNVFMLLTPKASVSFLFSSENAGAALDRLRSFGYTSVPVLEEDGRYAGSVSEGDFLWALYDAGDIDTFRDMKLKNILSEGRRTTVRADVSIDELVLRVQNQNYVPVLDDRGYFIGIVTRREVIGYLLKREKKA